MDISVIFVVLGAAFLHAFWNFQVRGTEDKALGMAAVMFGHLPLAIIGLAYVGLPPAGAWPYVMVSAVLHLWNSGTIPCRAAPLRFLRRQVVGRSDQSGRTSLSEALLSASRLREAFALV